MVIFVLMSMLNYDLKLVLGNLKENNNPKSKTHNERTETKQMHKNVQQ